MNWLSDDHSGYSTKPLKGNADQCCAWISKRLREEKCGDMATRYRPSGDQRGDHMPTDPGTFSTRPVVMSRMLKEYPFGSVMALDSKTILCPSGDQYGSYSAPSSSGRSLRGDRKSTRLNSSH